MKHAKLNSDIAQQKSVFDFLRFSAEGALISVCAVANCIGNLKIREKQDKESTRE